MAKNNVLSKRKTVEDDFDFSGMIEMEEEFNDELMAAAMNSVIEASNNQMMLAIELTRLAVEKSTAQEMNEDRVLAIFNKASDAIVDRFPLKGLWEKFTAND